MADEKKHDEVNPKSQEQISDEQLDDASGGAISGHRTYKPIMFRKRIDKSSPLINQEDDFKQD
jgi:type VI protein secretion system component Hcp